VGVPTRDEALAWLRTKGVDRGVAEATLDASMGNPGLAEGWIADSALDLRAECLADLAALSASRAQPLAVAERWAADRPGLRLWFASALAREEVRRIGEGRRGELGLTRRTEIPKLAAWFGRANRARSLLSTPLRADLVLLDLLRDWPARTAGRA
jgi:DNA polymerase-3 subunit delta'